ncbi:hypothetical protein NXX23_10245 [Bacteroides ovatus]|nr:hypothetical protein [Bacteroides ovatus]MEB3372914.1 hypothetical protein [Bacteroides sp. CR5/BHMF/2]
MSANTGTCSTSATICLIIDIYHCINRIFLITIIKTIVDKNTTNGAVNEYIFTIEFDAILPTIIPMIDIKRG